MFCDSIYKVMFALCGRASKKGTVEWNGAKLFSIPGSLVDISDSNKPKTPFPPAYIPTF